MTYQGRPPAPPPPQTDKVKLEGQMLPNIDLSKHSPTLRFSDVTTLLIHHGVLQIWSCFWYIQLIENETS